MPLTPEQIKEQNEKKAMQELRVRWLKNNRHKRWYDIAVGKVPDQKAETEIALIRGEAKVDPRNPMEAGYLAPEDGFFKKHTYYDGKNEVTIFGWPSASGIENAQHILASQGMLVSTYDVKPVWARHIEVLIKRYCDELGVSVGPMGGITETGKPPADPLKLLKLGPTIHAYISCFGKGPIGKILARTWLAKLLAGRSLVLLQLAKRCEQEFAKSINKVAGEKAWLYKDEIERLDKAINDLNNLDTRPPAPIAPADRDNHINNTVFAAGDTLRDKMDKMRVQVDGLAARQQYLLEEKNILTREIADFRAIATSNTSTPEEVKDVLLKLSKAEETRLELLEAMDKEEKDLDNHLEMWRDELNKPTYAGIPDQRDLLGKIADMEAKPRVDVTATKQDYLDVERQAQAKDAAPNPPAPPAPPAPAPGP